jgi:hypothetical protein
VTEPDPGPRRWWRIYVLVILDLALCILLMRIFTKAFS